MTTASATRHPWLWRHGSRRDGDVRLFCLPCAGHGASMYATWPVHLPPQLEVWALQPPGRENRLHETPLTSAATMAREAAAALEPLLDGRPFALVGHSMGALVAFELARELRRRGRALPDRLFVSGRSAPQVPPAGLMRHGLPDHAFVEEVRRLNSVLAGDDEYAEMIRFVLPKLRADFAVCERYRYVDEPPLACDVSVWGGDADPETDAGGLASWRDQTTRAFSLRMFPGDHFFLMTERRAVLRVLADQVEQVLCPAGARPTRSL